jgi:hypothetical protein
MVKLFEIESAECNHVAPSTGSRETQHRATGFQGRELTGLVALPRPCQLRIAKSPTIPCRIRWHGCRLVSLIPGSSLLQEALARFRTKNISTYLPRLARTCELPPIFFCLRNHCLHYFSPTRDPDPVDQQAHLKTDRLEVCKRLQQHCGTNLESCTAQVFHAQHPSMTSLAETQPRENIPRRSQTVSPTSST